MYTARDCQCHATTMHVHVGKRKHLADFALGNVSMTLGTGIRGLMRGMATLPQGNQELLVVRDKVGKPQVSMGQASPWNVIFFPSVL